MLKFRLTPTKTRKRESADYEETEVFKEFKEQVVKEVDDTLKLLKMNRLGLARLLGIQPSAVTQTLTINKGMQLTTLVRIADALGFYVEISFVRRGTAHPIPDTFMDPRQPF